MSGKIKVLIAAVFILLSAAALTFANSRMQINYCKGVVKLNDGFAVLKEDNINSAVIKIDGSGKITDRVNIFLSDPFALSVKSVHDMFADDDGSLYVMCTVYGPNRTIYDLIYKCNFTVGSGKKIWSSKQVSGYAMLESGIPYIDGDDIYLPMLNLNSGTVDILKFSGDSYTVVLEDCDNDDGYESDSIFYRNGVVYRAKDTIGVFADGEKIYPRSNDNSGETGMCDAMNYDNGILSFVDITANKLLHYDINAGIISEVDCSAVFAESVNRLQNLHAYSDGTITASREDGEYLRAYLYHDGSEETYTLVTGGVFFRAFVLFVIISAIAVAIVVLLYTLLFVRIRRQNGSARRYQTIAARITAISTAAGIICGIVFGVLINSTVKRINSGLQDSIDTNGSEFLAGYIFTECELETRNGMPIIGGSGGSSLNTLIERCQSALAEKNSIECSFLLLAEYNGKLYRLGDQLDETVPAEYIVSIRTAELIKNSIDTGVNCTFEDKMTSGRLQYTCTNFPIYGANQKEYNGVICTVSDAYRIKQTAFLLYLWLIAVIILLVALLLAAANIVLHYSLSGLKRLRGALELYENGGEPSVFSLPGGDEISETGQALVLMTEGTRVHARDINEGNRKYKRFVAAGILKIMDRSEISKVNFGDRVSKSALILRFLIENSSDASETFKLINGFIEMSGGILLNFGGGKADVCFTDEYDYGRAADMAARLKYPYGILASFGTVEAGSAGSDSNAWLIALSEELTEFDRLEKLLKSGGSAMICTKKAADILKGDTSYFRCEFGEKTLGDTEYYEIIPKELGEGKRETHYNSDSDGDAGGSLDPVL